jgi:hypothetical protein
MPVLKMLYKNSSMKTRKIPLVLANPCMLDGLNLRKIENDSEKE